MTNGVAPGAPVAGPVAATKSGRLRWWYIAVPLLLITLIGQLDKLAISVVMSNKQFLQDLKLVGRPAVVGLLMSGFLLSYSVFHFFWGYFVKKFGPRISAITGIIVWACTLVLSGIAETATAMVTARVILGVGEAFMFPVANTFVANWFPVKERSRAGAFWLNGFVLGPMLGGALVVAVVAAGGWRMAFFALAALSILIPLPMTIFLMRDHPRQQKRVSDAEAKFIEEGSLAKTKEVPRDAAVETKGYLSNYRFWLVTIAWGLNNIYFWGWATWMPTYFQNARHFSFQASGYIFSITFFFALIAIWLTGYYSDRAMRRAPFATGAFFVTGLAMYLGGSVGIIGNPYWAFAVLGLSICADEGAFLMVHALMQSIVPERSMGAAIGVAGGISMLISVPSPWLIGLLVGISGFGTAVVFLGLSAFIPGILTAFLIKEGY